MTVSEDIMPREMHIPSNCRCETCKLSRFETSKIRNAVIHSYSYKPRGSWKMRQGKDDPFNYFLGVELETDNYSHDERGYTVRGSLSNQQAADLRRPKNFWVAKHDGSVTGPEFASHPATLTYWHSKKTELSAMFKMLVHAGYRSFDNDKAGMHVNISKSAFDDSAHFFRFLTLVHVDAAWSLKMSQRTADSASRWAKINHSSVQTEIDREAHAINVMERSYMVRYHDRYVAVNAPSREPRVEFRLPRGTLRIDRFYKNLEWTVAMVEFTRETRATKTITPENFMAWVQAQPDKTLYPNLIAFIKSKFKTKRAPAGMVPTERVNYREVVSTPTFDESMAIMDEIAATLDNNRPLNYDEPEFDGPGGRWTRWYQNVYRPRRLALVRGVSNTY